METDPNKVTALIRLETKFGRILALDYVTKYDMT